MYLYTCFNFITFRVFSTVAESVGQHLSPKSSSVVSWPFMNNALITLIKTLLKCIDVIIDENIIEAGKIFYLVIYVNLLIIPNYFVANNCIWLILDILQTQMQPINGLMIKVIEKEMTHIEEFKLTVMVSMFRMISKVCFINYNQFID